ncbi:MAG TPA: hypothetical protein VGM54_02265 [Chthoniobacter sp.]|jgi:lysine/ornithine N-monooxygenase
MNKFGILTYAAAVAGTLALMTPAKTFGDEVREIHRQQGDVQSRTVIHEHPDNTYTSRSEVTVGVGGHHYHHHHHHHYRQSETVVHVER